MGAFQKGLRALKSKNSYIFTCVRLWIKCISFNVRVRYFVWNFKGNFWNSTQNILPMHWKIRFLYNIEILGVLGVKSSQVFLNRPPETCLSMKTVFSSYKHSHYKDESWYRLISTMEILYLQYAVFMIIMIMIGSWINGSNSKSITLKIGCFSRYEPVRSSKIRKRFTK